jgi:pyridoxine/pyridoxamine 5'-phosphate oxidase
VDYHQEAHAMTLSTVDAQGLPRARVLILKAVDANGWHFAVNSVSQKGRDLSANPTAALTFYWPALVRQVRIGGTVIGDGAEANHCPTARSYKQRSTKPTANSTMTPTSSQTNGSPTPCSPSTSNSGKAHQTDDTSD